ncbi:MAG: hypothetical protein ABIO70_12985 [Pseudomonadota bacterium]
MLALPAFGLAAALLVGCGTPEPPDLPHAPPPPYSASAGGAAVPAPEVAPSPVGEEDLAAGSAGVAPDPAAGAPIEPVPAAVPATEPADGIDDLERAATPSEEPAGEVQ